jgi:hypothetical protein
MKSHVLVLFLLIAISHTASAQLQHDVSVDSMVAPIGYISIGLGAIPTFHITNRGLADEFDFPVTCAIRDKTGSVIYRDTIRIDTLKASQSKDVWFNAFTPLLRGTHQICAVAILATDQNKSNDSTCGDATGQYDIDFKGIAVEYPKLNDSILYGTLFHPVARFQNVGLKDAPLPSRISIRNVETGQLGLINDTTISDLVRVDSTVTVTFNGKEGPFDITKLPVGYYQLAAIARALADGDRTNDTAFTYFTIYANHDLSADTILNFRWKVTLDTIRVSIRCRNRGVYDEPSAKVALVITDTGGARRYSDTVTVTNFLRNETRDLTFADWIPLQGGNFTACATALLPNDERPVNDEVCATELVYYAHNLQALTLHHPSPNDVLPHGEPINPIASFYNGGARTITSPIRYVIRSCTDHSVVFQFDTIVNDIAPGSFFLDTCGSTQGIYDNATLPIGCYELFAIARDPYDEHREDDTATVTFTIEDISSVEEIQSPSLTAHLSPNPSSGVITLSLSQPEVSDVMIDIVDEAGRIVAKEQLHAATESTFKLDVSSLPDGHYMARVRAGEQQRSVPFVLFR